jgi:microsomal dipeptidase-like Zn-dependent dipeptidase
MKEIILNADFNKLMNSIKTIEDVGAGTRILEYFENKGYNVNKYRKIQETKAKNIIAKESN